MKALAAFVDKWDHIVVVLDDDLPQDVIYTETRIADNACFYWYHDVESGWVSFWLRHDGASYEHKGGALGYKETKLTDGRVIDTTGSWSSRSSIFNKHIPGLFTCEASAMVPKYGVKLGTHWNSQKVVELMGKSGIDHNLHGTKLWPQERKEVSGQSD